MDKTQLKNLDFVLYLQPKNTSVSDESQALIAIEDGTKYQINLISVDGFDRKKPTYSVIKQYYLTSSDIESDMQFVTDVDGIDGVVCRELDDFDKHSRSDKLDLCVLAYVNYPDLLKKENVCSLH